MLSELSLLLRPLKIKLRCRHQFEKAFPRLSPAEFNEMYRALCTCAEQRYYYHHAKGATGEAHDAACFFGCSSVPEAIFLLKWLQGTELSLTSITLFDLGSGHSKYHHRESVWCCPRRSREEGNTASSFWPAHIRTPQSRSPLFPEPHHTRRLQPHRSPSGSQGAAQPDQWQQCDLLDLHH